jgi:hypothetical protein
MISLIISILPIILILYYFILFRKRENISWDLKRGLKCQSCKEDIEQDPTAWMSKSFDNENISTCVSYKRDESIDSVIGGKKHLISKIRVFMISDKFKTFQKVLLGLMVLIIVLNIICFFKGIKIGTFILNTFNTIYWTIMIVHNRFTTIKKIK